MLWVEWRLSSLNQKLRKWATPPSPQLIRRASHKLQDLISRGCRSCTPPSWIFPWKSQKRRFYQYVGTQGGQISWPLAQTLVSRNLAYVICRRRVSSGVLIMAVPPFSWPASKEPCDGEYEYGGEVNRGLCRPRCWTMHHKKHRWAVGLRHQRQRNILVPRHLGLWNLCSTSFLKSIAARDEEYWQQVPGATQALGRWLMRSNKLKCL